jgi:hypothetical protein
LPIPASDKAYHYGESSPTRESYYYLTNDSDDIEVIQSWDHPLEDLHTDKCAYSSRNRVLERII